MKKISRKRIIDSIPGSCGEKVTIAKRAGIDKSTLYKLLKKDSGLRDLIMAEYDNVKEPMVQAAREGLLESAKKGNVTAQLAIMNSMAEEHLWRPPGRQAVDIHGDMTHTIKWLGEGKKGVRDNGPI